MDNQVLRAFLFYASILVGKTLFMSPFTGYWRFKKGVSFTPFCYSHVSVNVQLKLSIQL